jgi:hypothetical protein
VAKRLFSQVISTTVCLKNGVDGSARLNCTIVFQRSRDVRCAVYGWVGTLRFVLTLRHRQVLAGAGDVNREVDLECLR